MRAPVNACVACICITKCVLTSSFILSSVKGRQSQLRSGSDCSIRVRCSQRSQNDGCSTLIAAGHRTQEADAGAPPHSPAPAHLGAGASPSPSGCRAVCQHGSDLSHHCLPFIARTAKSGARYVRRYAEPRRGSVGARVQCSSVRAPLVNAS